MNRSVDEPTGLRTSPTFQTLLIFAAVFVVQTLLALVSRRLVYGLFVLTPPISVRPWTLLLSVYSHAGLTHLVANAVALVLVGFPIEYETTPLRFHLFFASVGMAAGIAQVAVSAFYGGIPAVLGASGAVFGLLGYLLVGNVVADAVFERLPISGRTQVAIVLVLAGVVTLLTAAPRVALVAHFTGFVLGALAGRVHLLRTRRET